MGAGLDPYAGLGFGLGRGLGCGAHVRAAHEADTGRVSCAEWNRSERELALRTAMAREPAAEEWYITSVRGDVELRKRQRSGPAPPHAVTIRQNKPRQQQQPKQARREALGG